MNSRWLVILMIVFGAPGSASVLADDDDEVVPGQVVVKFVPGADVKTFVLRWRAQYGAEIVDVIDGRPVYLIGVFEGDEEEFVDDIMFDPVVERAEPNYTGQDTNPDPGTQSIFVAGKLSAYRQQPALSIIGAASAQSIARGGGVTVAVIDSGLDVTHPELSGRIAPGQWNFIDESTDVADTGDGIDNDGDELIDEAVGHGTLVAGLIVRVAPDVQLLPLKVLDSDGFTTTFRMVEAVYYALDRDIALMNISMGTTQRTFVIEEAMGEALSRGAIVVASTGNEDTSSPVRYPSALPGVGVIGVAATDDNDIRAEFSNFGEHVAISAPGVGVTSTVPGGGFGRADGTSFGAPLVAGTLALMRSASPGAGADVLRQRLLSTATPIDPLNPGYVGLLGDGRLDALAAVDFCFADCDATGMLDILDFLCFQDAFAQMAPYADCDHTGGFDVFDFVCFQDKFVAGCS